MCFSIFACEYIKSFPVFHEVMSGVKVIEGFNPLSGFVGFEVVSDCTLELTVKAEEFRIFGALIIIVELSGSGDQRKVLRK